MFKTMATTRSALRSTTGRLRFGLQWDAPITRIQERNNYRQILIEYQRARRSYYQYEDGVWNTMRASLRAIRQNQMSFEIQRFAVQTAALQIGINEDLRSISETLGTVQGPTAARDATTALQSLLDTQNQLIGIFVNYEAQRRGLDLNLGTMQLDAEGLWLDPGPMRVDTLGGVFGNAVFNYGLSENEMRMREQMGELDCLPLEVAPSDRLPPTLAPNVSDIPGEFPGDGNLPFVPQPNGEAEILQAPGLQPISPNSANGIPANGTNTSNLPETLGLPGVQPGFEFQPRP